MKKNRGKKREYALHGLTVNAIPFAFSIRLKEKQEKEKNGVYNLMKEKKK